MGKIRYQLQDVQASLKRGGKETGDVPIDSGEGLEFAVTLDQRL